MSVNNSDLSEEVSDQSVEDSDLPIKNIILSIEDSDMSTKTMIHLKKMVMCLLRKVNYVCTGQ